MWLLQTATKQALQQAQAAGVMPSAEQQLDYEARMSAASGGDMPRLLTVAGNSAEIEIRGAITDRPSMFAFMFGGGNTTYPDIISALAVAEQDPTVEKITLSIDSPGGTVAGLFDALAAIEATTKPVRAVVSNMAASAAFAIAAQADEIVAGNRAARFGSVGIVVHAIVDENEVTITSSGAPKKAPDLSTEAGQADVREELDAMEDLFVDAIASGRGTSAEAVRADFGQGATVLAGEALSRGMIDRIADTALSLVQTGGDPAATIENQPEAIDMDLTTLKATHPAVYAEAVAEGSALGVTAERDRVGAFIVAGEMSGDMKTAITAVQDGSEMTATLQTQFMMATANRRDITASLDDDGEAAAATAALATAAQDDSADAKASAGILSATAEALGVDLEA